MESWIEAARARFGGELRAARASMVFTVIQGVRHSGRSTGYANTVLCVRVGSGTGTAAVAPGTLTGAEMPGLVGDVVGAIKSAPPQIQSAQELPGRPERPRRARPVRRRVLPAHHQGNRDRRLR